MSISIDFMFYMIKTTSNLSFFWDASLIPIDAYILRGRPNISVHNENSKRHTEHVGFQELLLSIKW